MAKLELKKKVIEEIVIPKFRQRFPWIGADLQTLRDTFVDENLYLYNSEVVQIAIPPKYSRSSSDEHLIAFLNCPLHTSQVKGLILMLHGLGGSSQRRGLRRMAASLLAADFAVLRLNLRGANPGREYAAGTYAANCSSDIFPAIEKAREIANLLARKKDLPIPLFGVGLSLGGTILLNACLDCKTLSPGRSLLDGLVCISSPLDLEECSLSIERLRNRFYQTWLLNRLVRQTLEDPFGIADSERDQLLIGNVFKTSITSSIKAFDSAITAPRWGYKNVDDYYRRASPIYSLNSDSLEMIPKTLLIQSLDDPWVPSQAIENLYMSIKKRKLDYKVEILLTKNGGHNGFHSLGGCWGDEVVKRWLLKFANITAN